MGAKSVWTVNVEGTKQLIRIRGWPDRPFNCDRRIEKV